MKRITTIGITCFLVALSGAAVAIASSGKGPGNRSDDSTTSTTGTTGTTTSPADGIGRRRGIDGRVVAIDATAKTFDLRVRRHHRRGKTVTITVTDATVYKNLPNGFDSIAVRYRIKAKVRRVNGALVASRVERKRAHEQGDDDQARGNDDGPNHDANDDRGGDDRGGNSGRGGNDD